jgi:hypothetical protein
LVLKPTKTHSKGGRFAMSLPHASLFAQLLDLVPRPEFERLARLHGVEARSKGFSSWDQFVAMLFCQLGQAHSLREIVQGLASAMGKLVHVGLRRAPSRATLSYANEHRPWVFYRELFGRVLERGRLYAKGKGKLRLRAPVYLLDATVIDLCLEVFNWARFRRAKGAVKLHLVLEHEGHLPVFAHITDGKVHEVRMARRLNFPPGAIVVMDRAYNDYTLFNEWCERDVSFVTRMKDNAVYEVLERYAPQGETIRRDEWVLLTGTGAQAKCPHVLRRIVVWDPQKRRELVLLTNILDLAASTVARLYKERWQIELFFKALKQNFRVKTFVGTSANAVKTQLWTALLAILLLKILQLRSAFKWSLSNLVAILRMNLFTYRNLWEWLDEPFDTPPLLPQPIQLELPFPKSL